MKTLSLILLCFSILLQPLSKLVVVAEYQVNKNYIAEFLCVNKSRPMLHCEGKCQLSKKLKAAEEHTNEQPAPLKSQVEVLYFNQVPPTFSFQFHSVSQTEFGAVFTQHVTPPVFGIFHPPCFLA